MTTFVSALSDRSQKILSELDQVLCEYKEGNVRRPPEAATNAFSDLRKRCESYADWDDASSPIPPGILALYGWDRIGDNLLHCKECSSCFSLTVPIVENLDFGRKFTDDMLRLVKSAHGELCYYRRAHDPKFLCFRRLPSRHDFVTGFFSRLASLAVVKEGIKRLNIVPSFVLEMEDHELEAVSSSVSLGAPCSEAELLLALCGWSACKESGMERLLCSCCSRQLDLSRFACSTDPFDSQVPDRPNKSAELPSSSFERTVLKHWRVALKELLQNRRKSVDKSAHGLLDRFNEMEASLQDLLNSPGN